MQIAKEKKNQKLLEQVREYLRMKHYSYNTEKAYIYRIREFIIFHKKRHPREMGAEEIKSYLSWLAITKGVSASTQNQALNAIVFLYKQILRQDPGDFSSTYRAKSSNYIPTIISRKEIAQIIEGSRGVYRLMFMLLYGCGLRISELFELRIQNLDIEGRQLRIYESKGNRSRTVMLPEASIPLIQNQLLHCRKEWEEDRRLKYNGVEVPYAQNSRNMKVGESWNWFWLFPAMHLSKDPRSGIRRRHHLHKSTLQKYLKIICNKLKLTTRFTPHCFRHCFATHLLENGYDINTVQRLLGHAKIQTTMMYLHTLESRNKRVASPLDKFDFNKPKKIKRPKIKRAYKYRDKIKSSETRTMNSSSDITNSIKPEIVNRE